MNANKQYLNHLFDLWTEYWDKIDRSKVTDDDVPETLDKFKKELRHSKYTRWWSLTNLAEWGMQGYYIGHSIADNMLKHCDDSSALSEVPKGYLLWKWKGKQFLIDCTTYDAYETKLVVKTIKYKQYELVK